MKRAIILALAVLFLVQGGQAVLTMRFAAQPPRIEIRGDWQGAALTASDTEQFARAFPGAVFDEADPARLSIDIPPSGSVFYAQEALSAANALRAAKGSAPALSVYDYTYSHTLVWQFTRIVAFCAVLTVVALAARLIFSGVARKIRHIRAESRYTALSGYLATHMVELLTGAIVTMLTVLACVVLFRLASFQLYIPPRYLPPQYLFDIEFYWGLLQSGGAGSASDFGRAYGLTLACGAASTALSLVPLAVLYRQGSRLLGARYEKGGAENGNH